MLTSNKCLKTNNNKYEVKSNMNGTFIGTVNKIERT